MGRHAKGAPRPRISMSTVVLGTLIVAVVAVGSLWSSRAQPTPIAARGVDGVAVVVLSPVCDGIPGRTLVDVVSPAGFPAGTNVRTSLDACGYQEGEQLAVQFPAGDPTQLTLTGSDAADDTMAGGRLLPYGIVIALLLAMAAAAAVWIDGRRRRDGGYRTIAVHQAADSIDRSGDDSPAARPRPTTGAGQQVSTGRHARLEGDPNDGAGEEPTSRMPVVRVLATASIGTASIGAASLGGESAAGFGRGLTTADLVFPSRASLAASLNDELFTHRSG